MNKKVKTSLIVFASFFVLSIIFTILLLTVDVRESFHNPKLGLATLNEKVFTTIGESRFWYYFTQILGYLAILVVVCFAVIGVIQLIKNKSIKKVDKEIIGLGIVYVIIAIIYVFFEKVVVVNYRPILKDGVAAASFPSSHTLLACVVFSTALLEAKKLINIKFIKENLVFLLEFLVILMAGGRLLSGVHWLSDIVASILYSGVIVSGYYLSMYYLDSKKEKEIE